MRAVQITRFGGPEVMDDVDLPDPVPGDGEQLFDISSSGVNFAYTHQVEDSYLSRTRSRSCPAPTSSGGWRTGRGLPPSRCPAATPRRRSCTRR
jgi:NADPH:quinone reductase-like Zn-dependent oxidoreductase